MIEESEVDYVSYIPIIILFQCPLLLVLYYCCYHPHTLNATIIIVVIIVTIYLVDGYPPYITARKRTRQNNSLTHPLMPV